MIVQHLPMPGEILRLSALAFQIPQEVVHSKVRRAVLARQAATHVAIRRYHHPAENVGAVMGKSRDTIQRYLREHEGRIMGSDDYPRGYARLVALISKTKEVIHV